MKNALWLSLIFMALQGCLGHVRQPKEGFGKIPTPPRPDYSQTQYWAGLPTLRDAPDAVPKNSGLKDEQDKAEVDVFFVHPTLYNTGKAWNADPKDAKFNKNVDRTTIKYQASVYNGTCRVYAPRYRQAAMAAYTEPAAKAAFDTAYADVVAAFDYFIKNYNNDRPFFLAGHSQGSGHILRLLQEKVHGTALANRFIAAYVIGHPSYQGWITEPAPFCTEPEQTGCFVNYNSFEWKAPANHPSRKQFQKNIVVNPLTFTCDSVYCPASLNKGSLNIFFKLSKKPLFDAQIKHGGIATHKKGGLSFFHVKGDYHIMDYNLYYMNLRENIAQRAAAFLKKQKGK